MSAHVEWPRNRLLLALPRQLLNRLLPELEQVDCRVGNILIEAEASLDHVYFPDSGVISAVAVYAHGNTIEMATIGREGATAPQALFGAKRSSARFLVQVPGTAARMTRSLFDESMDTIQAFRRLMFAYTGAFLDQVMVSAACNGQHSVNERLARWLLMMRDRTDSDALVITQSVLSEMLGVERPTVTNALRAFEREGLIKSRRGELTLRDRQGLMRRSCECYHMVRERTAFHLPKTYPENPSEV